MEEKEKDCSQEVCYEIVSPRNVRSHTHKVSPTWLPKLELNKGDVNRHANMDEKKTHEASTLLREYKE